MFRVFARAFSVFVCVFTLSLGLSAPSLSSDAVEQVQYEYDDLGRLVTVKYLTTGRTFRYSYDAAGNRTEHKVEEAAQNTIRLWNTHVFEGGTLSFGVWRVGQAQHNITVHYDFYEASSLPSGVVAAKGGSSCTGDVDFVIPSNRSVTIPAGGISSEGSAAYINIQTCEDAEEEGITDPDLPQEKVFIKLTSAIGGELDPNKSERIGRIKDDDGALVKFHIRDASIDETGSEIVFQILKIGDAKQTESVDIELANRTAVAGEDYLPLPKTRLTFKAGETKKFFSVPIINDEVYEVSESFTATLSNPSEGADIFPLGDGTGQGSADGQGRAQGVIKDPEDIPRVYIGRTGIREGDGYVLKHTAWVDRDHTHEIKVQYTACLLGHMPAEQCSRYTGMTASTDDLDLNASGASALQGTITFPPGNAEASQHIRFVTKSDDRNEGEEHYVLSLDKVLPTANSDIPSAMLDEERSAAFGYIRSSDPGVAAFNIWGDQVIAGNPLIFTVRRWGDTSQRQTIKYRVVDDRSGADVGTPLGGATRGGFIKAKGGASCTSGVDYIIPAAGSEISFSPNGSDEKSFPITTCPTEAGSVYHRNKTLYVELGDITVEAPSGQQPVDTAYVVKSRPGFIKDSIGVELTATGGSFNEKDGKVEFELRLSRKMGEDIGGIKAHYHTVSQTGGTWAGLGDYKPTAGVVTFTPKTEYTEAETVKTVQVDILDDVENEGSEQIKLFVQPDIFAFESEDPTSAIATILDDPNDGCNARLNITANDEVHEDDYGTSFVVKQTSSGECTGNTLSLGGGIMGMVLSSVQQDTGIDMTDHEYLVEILPGSATEGEDFKAKSLTIVLNELYGDSTTISTEIIDDLINESTEDLIVRVTPCWKLEDPGVNCATADIPTEDTRISIIDNDPGPKFSVSDVTAGEGHVFSFLVTKEGEAEGYTHVTYTTVNKEAVAGEDYSPVSDVLSFAPGETAKTVTVQSLQDSVFESDETFVLELSKPSLGAAISKGEAVATIAEDDAAPVLTITDATAYEGEQLKFHLYLDRPSAKEHRVDLIAHGDSAETGVDFVGIQTQLVFAPGVTEQILKLDVISDDVFEMGKPEEMRVVLSNLTGGATLGDSEGKGYIYGMPYEPVESYFIPKGSNLRIDMAGAQGGHGVNASQHSGGRGGRGIFELTAAKDFYLRYRAGKRGMSREVADWGHNDIPRTDKTGGDAKTNGNGLRSAGTGGGATSIIISNDGVIWTPVAIVGGGGGSAFYENWTHLNRPGNGGGLNLSGSNHYEVSQKVGYAYSASPSAYGEGGISGTTQIGGDGGSPGRSGGRNPQAATIAPGNGDVLFGIAGGGAGGWDIAGGGSGRYGGGGGIAGGGGSGYWNAEAWIEIAGVEPTINTNTTGDNSSDGYVNFGSYQPQYTTPTVPAKPANYIVVSDASVSEGGKMTFTLVNLGSSPSDVTLSYSITPGTATVEDYVDVRGAISFSAGSLTQTVQVQTLQDTLTEEDSKFSLALAVQTGEATLQRDIAIGAIINDDYTPTFAHRVLENKIFSGVPFVVEIERSVDLRDNNAHSVDIWMIQNCCSGEQEPNKKVRFEPGERKKLVEFSISGRTGESWTVLLKQSDPAIIENSHSGPYPYYSVFQLAEGVSNFGVNTNEDNIYLIPAGREVLIDMGAAGTPNSISTGSIARGGVGSFKFTTEQNVFVSFRVGRKSTSHAWRASQDAGMGAGGGLVGGGATAVTMSLDGETWTPVAIVGGAGGAGSNPHYGYGGHGGGLNQNGTSGFNHYGQGTGGSGAQVSSPGHYGGGTPGSNGANGQKNGGRGDVKFGLAGGGSATGAEAGGGGGGRYGGGGGHSASYGGGGGSGYFDAVSIQNIAGGLVELLSATVGGNSADGYVVVGASLPNGSNSPSGEAVFTEPGTHTWTVPDGVTTVSVVAVGAGGGQSGMGGGGGALAWKNNVPVTAGQNIEIKVGSAYESNARDSVFGNIMTAGGGNDSGQYSKGGVRLGRFDGGGDGGQGGKSAFFGQGDSRNIVRPGGGGAAGYLGNGGNGGTSVSVYSDGWQYSFANATKGAGGGGGGGGLGGNSNSGYHGGGVSLYGIGEDGRAGTSYTSDAEQGVGGKGSPNPSGQYGGGEGSLYPYPHNNGQGSHNAHKAQNGAVRIIWGDGCSFPYNAQQGCGSLNQ